MDQRMSFPPGTYFIGDLCYVLTEATWQGLPCPPAVGSSWRATVQGYPLWLGWTAFGDGVYDDQHGYSYGVDSGTLGVIPVVACDQRSLAKATGQGLGRTVTFHEPFTPTCEDGRFVFDDVTIETHRIDEEEHD